MKFLILALLVAFSVSAMAGKPTKEQIASPASVEGNSVKQCGSGDPSKGSNVDMRKGLNAKGGNPCDDGVDRNRAPTPDAPSAKAIPPKK